MKIGPEHIGKRVYVRIDGLSFLSGKSYKVCYVGEKDFLDENKSDWPLVSANGEWELVEEPKQIQKPSERIKELCLKEGLFPNSMVNPGFHSILGYLDEVMPGLLEKK